MENWLLRWGAPEESSWTERMAANEASFRWGNLTLSFTQHPPNVLTAEGASRCLVVLGQFSASARHLEVILDRHQSPSEVLKQVHALPGSFHIIYADTDTLRVQGPASGALETFFGQTRVNGDLWVSNSPAAIARQLSAHPDLSMLAMSLLYPGLDYGLATHTYWKGVTRLPSANRLIARNGVVTQETWWDPDLDLVPIDEGAGALAEALQSAVACRTSSKLPVTADLSGGLDSTSLCVLLSATGQEFRPFVERTEDPNHDDYIWASDAAQAMGQPLTILDQDHLPGPYDGIVDSSGNPTWEGPAELNAPYSIIRNRTRKARFADLVTDNGHNRSLHFSGFGADELFTVAPAHVVDVYEKKPFKAIRASRKLSFLRRWSSSQVRRALSQSGTYQAWVEREATLLDSPFNPHLPTLDWGPQLRLPPWATAEATRLTREHLTSVQPEATPQHPTRSLHIAIGGQRLGGIRLAPLSRLFANKGLQLTMPYMDDAVLEASLRVRRSDSPPGEAYKPLLVNAMKQVQDNPVLGRSTKGEFSKSVEMGILKNLDGLNRLFSNSYLQEAGLLDAQAFKKSLNNPFRPQNETGAFELTIAAEIWLREVEAHWGLP